MDGTSSRRSRLALVAAVALVASLGLVAGVGAQVDKGKTPAIALVPGGAHPYFGPWAQGLKDAAKRAGISKTADRFPQTFNLDQQNQVIENLVAQGYNGFGIFPDDANGTNSTINELAGRGIPAINLAGCTNDPSKALFCFGTDVYHSAYLGTKHLIAAMGGRGNVVHVTGFLVDPNTKLRMNAVKKAVDETKGKVKLIQTLADIDAVGPANKAIGSLLAAKAKQIDGIVGTAYIPSQVTAQDLRNLGDKRIKMVGIDDAPQVIGGIKDGYVTGTMLQNPYGQAYLGTLALTWVVQDGCKVKANAPFVKTPQTTKFIDSGTLFIGKGQTSNYDALRKKLTLSMLKTFKAKYFSC